MDDQQRTTYAILRDGTTWDRTTTHNLEMLPDGSYRLARLPGLPPGRAIDLPGPYETAPSGLAAGNCGDLYIADTQRDRVIFREGTCGTEMLLPGRPGPNEAPGHFRQPRGMALYGQETLYVADSGSRRIQALRLPGLVTRQVLDGIGGEPAALAVDRQGRVYALGLDGSVVRFLADGTPDPAFQAALASDPELIAPRFLAVDAAGIVYLAETASNRVLRYDPEGNPLGMLPPGAGAAPARPRCLLAYRERLYIADAAGGRVWAYDLAAGTFLGTLSGYRGPAAAMAQEDDGDLLIKPGLDAAVYRMEAEAGCAAWGVLQAGPLEAGLGDRWRRARVDVGIPAGGQVLIDQFVRADPDPPPQDSDWVRSAAHDWLVEEAGRFLWLRVRLYSEGQAISPQIVQVQAETNGEDYLDSLPAVYRRHEPADGFLRRWLHLFRAELSGLEQLWKEMHLRFDPLRAPEDHLAWLAGWLGFRLPERLPPQEWRQLLLRVHQLYLRRGTPQGVADFVELYCGVRPVILETYRSRSIWVLGKTAALSLTTGLAALLPDGMVVPEAAPDGAGGWTEPAGLVVGDVVVGQSAPQAADAMGEGLFLEAAHHFTVLVPAAAAPQPGQRALLIETLEAEKPAHTDYDLCLVEARLRVGCQFRLGIDAIVAGAPDPLELGAASVGRSAVLAAGDAPAAGELVVQ